MPLSHPVLHSHCDTIWEMNAFRSCWECGHDFKRGDRVKKAGSWSSLVAQCLKIQCSHCCGIGLIPRPGMSTCHGWGMPPPQKKEEKRKEQLERYINMNSKSWWLSRLGPGFKGGPLFHSLHFLSVFLNLHHKKFNNKKVRNNTCRQARTLFEIHHPSSFWRLKGII